jgi:NAD(P)-dependent dehydrogenase (short-subunit alcohol dehydrogenase family)
VTRQDETIAMGTGRLAGRRAIITGAGTGIGRAVAIAYARQGALVALIGRRPEPLDEVRERIAEAGGHALALPCDVGREAEVEQAFSVAEREFDGLDTVVGVAGIEPYGRGDDRVDRLELDVWERVISANLTGMFLTLKHGARALIKSGGGSIIVTGSPTAIRGHAPGEFAYSSSKAGTHGMVRQTAAELAHEGIRVNCVIPGLIDTPINAGFFAMPGARAEAEARIPLKRAGQPDDVAGIYVWLASDEASYTTGAFMVVDGGQISVC